jgi:hypothetical protein
MVQWGFSYPATEVALVAAAFQNQGYQLPSNPADLPTGLYEKYVVQRAINYVIAGLRTLNLGLTPNSHDPCQGGPIPRRSSLLMASALDSMKVVNSTLAASGALDRTVAMADVLGNFSGDYVVGKTYGDILQRMANSSAWGQGDSSRGRGGWAYTFNSVRGDGSTLGWELLGLFDAQAAGIIVPQWVKDEVDTQMGLALNEDGTLDYTTDGNPSADNNVGPEKNGIGLQGLFFIDETTGARVDSVKTVIDDWWDGAGTIGASSWRCGWLSPPDPRINKGCA